MHITIAFSPDPIDWLKVGQPYSDKTAYWSFHLGGARRIERFNEGAIVLVFASSELSRRHKAIKRAGPAWDHPDYNLHITITYEGAPYDLKAI